MIFSRARRTATIVLIAAGLLAGALNAGRPAHAASRAPVVKPIILVVDTHLKASGLSQADALTRGGALLPITVSAPTYVPTGSKLFSVSIERPFYQVTKGVATLSYGSTAKGITFQIDEQPVPIYYAKATAILVSINGHPAVVYELGIVGKSHLVAVTWSVGKRYFDITSNLGKSGFAVSTLLKIAASVR